MFVEFGQGPWGAQTQQKIVCASGSFDEYCGKPKLFAKVKLYYFDYVSGVLSRTLGAQTLGVFERTMGSLNTLLL